MSTLWFDFETHDPDLTERGPGWVFGTTTILGMGYTHSLTGEIYYTEDRQVMIKELQKADTWVAHNLTYELGIAKYVLGIEFRDKVLRDTMVGAYLEDNRRMSFSLSELAKEEGLSKDQERFGRFVIEKRLFQPRYTKTDPEGIKSATKWAMKNLHVIAIEDPYLLREYCISDVSITRHLDHKYTQCETELYERFSAVQKICVEMRAKGVKIDEEQLFTVDKELTSLINKEEQKINDIVGSLFSPLNYRSSKQLAEAFKFFGIETPITDKGNPNIDTKFFLDCDHPLALAVYNAKKYTKARDNFVRGMEKFLHNGRLHGEMKLFGARDTGRFSHSLPNLAQIPRRDEVTGPLIRSLFVPEEDEQWYCLDFSAQEPRLMVHFAIKCQKAGVHFEYTYWDGNRRHSGVKKFNSPSIYDLQKKYFENPLLDSHNYNKELIKTVTNMDLERDQVKTIALGKAYGMGTAKLAKSLKIDVGTTKKLVDAFYAASPHLMQLDQYCKYIFNTRNEIKLLSGRTLKNDGFEHKALNKKIQGSAADQICEVLLKLYEIGIVPNLVVHDELDISCSKETAIQVQKIMQDAVSLEVPMVAEINCGSSWAEAK